jgi:hypothetical protein
MHLRKTIGDGFGQCLLVGRLTALPFELVHADWYLDSATRGRRGIRAQSRRRIELAAAGWAHGCVPEEDQAQPFDEMTELRFRIAAAF